jgi:hypothetical protein
MPKNDGMQGEGNKAADRRYREGATRFAKQGHVEQDPEKAKRKDEKEGRGEQERSREGRSKPEKRRPS